jgi:hypothetical protein
MVCLIVGVRRVRVHRTVAMPAIRITIATHPAPMLFHVVKFERQAVLRHPAAQSGNESISPPRECFDIVSTLRRIAQ